MSNSPQAETEEELELVKEHALFPILLDMLARDMNELKLYQDKIIYNHLIFYLQRMERFVHEELQNINSEMKKRGIRILNTQTSSMGIEVEYKVRGYIHHFRMLKSLIKAELTTLLFNMGRELE